MEFLEKIISTEEQLQHSIRIINERIILYGKRRIETRRALKAMHRASINPKSYQLFILLEAEIQFQINKKLIEILSKIVNKKITSKSPDPRIFKKNFEKIIIDFFLQKFEIKLISKELDSFLKIIFSTDDDYQRQKIGIFLLAHFEKILNVILNEIVIFDKMFLQNLINDLSSFLLNNYS